MYTSYVWDDFNCLSLIRKDGIGFEDVVSMIQSNRWVILDNPSSNHPEQQIFVIKYGPYPLVVPFRALPPDKILLITLYPSRKYKNIFSTESL
jgi:hypothetical protein